MRRRPMIGVAVCAIVLTLCSAAAGITEELPVVKGKKVVAIVQGEPITAEEFNREVAEMNHDAATKVDAHADLALLDRMINVTLIAQEARRMGLDKLPEVRRMVDSYARVSLRDELVERAVKEAKPDPGEVARLYEAAVRRWMITAVLFPGDDQAKALAAELAAGKDFVDVAKKYVADGRVKKMEERIVLQRDAMDPAIAQAAVGLAPGATSPIVASASGPVIFKVIDVVHADDRAARAKAEETALTNARKRAFEAYDETLKKKYVKRYPDVLKGLDYEAEKPGMAALAKDQRVLAEVKGEKPVTVAELTADLKFTFFHGPDLAAQTKKLNAKKQEALEGLLHRKVFRKEALRLHIDRSASYVARVKNYENSMLFDKLLHKAVAPDVKITEAEVRGYYDAHVAEYTSPEMIRIRALVFNTRTDAETAIESLRKGADFQWVAEHGEGQVDPNSDGLLSFDGRPIMTTELPADVRKVVAATKAGDIRLYASPDKRYYALVIDSVLPAHPRPFEDVRDEAQKKVLGAKFQKAVEDYAAKLRSLSEVKVYLKGS